VENLLLSNAAAGEFLQKTLDCLRSHIAVLNEDGTIIAVNAPWKKFASSNGLAEQFCGAGANYLRSCDRATGDCSEEASGVAMGIRQVIAKALEYFYLEYPCHSPSERRWFSVRITRFEIDNSIYAVVTHDDITQRRLAELKAQDATRLLAFQAITDGLTGIANRRSFDSRLEQEWKRHQRSQTPLSLAMLDLDFFKLYNDRQGHRAGDDCLKAVARAIQSNLGRPFDFVARYGGEEFVLILPNTDSAGAANVLENTLISIRSLAIPHPASTARGGVVTISIGCATVVPGEYDSPSELLHRADQALYEAKANGRDRLLCFEQENIPVV
jgi:diguanylate cyclase (GGDEF)-like protein